APGRTLPPRDRTSPIWLLLCANANGQRLHFVFYWYTPGIGQFNPDADRWNSCDLPRRPTTNVNLKIAKAENRDLLELKRLCCRCGCATRFARHPRCEERENQSPNRDK